MKKHYAFFKLFSSNDSRPSASDSIANSQSLLQIQTKLINPFNTKKVFLPSLKEKRMLVVIVSFVLFYSLMALTLQATYITDVAALWRTFVETLVMCTILSIGELGFVDLNKDRFQQQHATHKDIAKFLIVSTFITVPILSVFARGLLWLVLGYSLTMTQWILEVVGNTLLVSLMMLLLTTYFSLQYQHIKRLHQGFSQRLIEENEQLKARITPHFFFNMLNTMQYLIESDKDKAIRLVEHVSTLYRVSFKDIKEVAMIDEIELCQHYLSIEQYRFGSKLSVTWDLPDEDLLYDMVITSLTLQLVIEKMIVFVVEMTTATIFLKIRIDWQDDWVTIDVNANIPQGAKEAIAENIDKQLSFNNQVDILRQYYGEGATIKYYYDSQGIETTISYPLKDVAY